LICLRRSSKGQKADRRRNPNRHVKADAYGALETLGQSAANVATRLCGPPVLVKWNPRLSFEVILGGGPSPWQDEIDEFYVDQMRLFLDEFVFLHKRSRTLIVADLAHNLSDNTPVFTKWAYKLRGGLERSYN
jgi:hypothetical protein